MHAGSGPRRARGATSGDIPGIPRDPGKRWHALSDGKKRRLTLRKRIIHEN
jgi:hypothetical protein